ncbi:MAG: glycosyltransferase family 4 protein [Candidatus Portnoybacteria bacterium]|jgi:glycosyltransferase involved in cell wall biosynthesis|nr:glycosyltransferase family 4 protein [Candidatus Portnoybacteria bacterium]
MKILSLSLDKSILDKSSPLAVRAADLGDLVEKYVVIVPAGRDVALALSDKSSVFGVSGGWKVIKLTKIYRLAKRLFGQVAFDVVTSQDPYFLGFVAAKLAKKFSVGLEIQVHGWEKFSGLRKFVARRNLAQAKAVRCVSRRLKKQLINELGVAEEKITVVPIFSEKSQIPNSKSQNLKTEENNKFIFLTVGRLVPVKNIGRQIEALAEISKKHPNAELWVVGEGPERNNLKFKIENLKLGEKVKLLGQKSAEELAELYETVDAFVLTSDNEGWGLAVIEAASFGLPIIMADVGCAGEVIKDGISGIILPPDDKKFLARAMTQILSDESLRRNLGVAARHAVAALPDKEQTYRLYLQSWQKAAIK